MGRKENRGERKKIGTREWGYRQKIDEKEKVLRETT